MDWSWMTTPRFQGQEEGVVIHDKSIVVVLNNKSYLIGQSIVLIYTILKAKIM